jgi:hypothetical protein
MLGGAMEATSTKVMLRDGKSVISNFRAEPNEARVLFLQHPKVCEIEEGV